MSKLEVEVRREDTALLEERRKLRRVRMITELTLNLLRHESTLSYREARCLVDCARKAICELMPRFDRRFEGTILPHLERILNERWPYEQIERHTSEMVN